MLDLLECTQLSKEQKDCLQTAKRSADLLLTLINDLLDVVRIESGKLALCPAPFLLREQLNFLSGSMKSNSLAKGVEFNLTIEENVPDGVIADSNRVSQVLNNLVNNALKFTEEGGQISVHVCLDQFSPEEEVKQKDNDSIVLHFIVKDTGIGIPLEKQNQIFEPFFQVDLSHTKKFGGIGMGLKICSGKCLGYFSVPSDQKTYISLQSWWRG